MQVIEKISLLTLVLLFLPLSSIFINLFLISSFLWAQFHDLAARILKPDSCLGRFYSQTPWFFCDYLKNKGKNRNRLTLEQFLVRKFNQNTFDFINFFTIFESSVITSLAHTSAIMTFSNLLATSARI